MHQLRVRKKLDLRCMANVRCCGNLCSASPSKVLREQHLGFVSSLRLNADYDYLIIYHYEKEREVLRNYCKKAFNAFNAFCSGTPHVSSVG